MFYRKGDRFVLNLRKYIDGSYIPATCASSYFFIAHDDKVYVGSEESWSDDINGMSLPEFKQVVVETRKD